MNNKILIGAIAGLVVIGIIAYLVIANPLGLGIKQGTIEGTTITSLSLESFPAGTQMGPGLTGTETTTIKIGEIVGLKGTATADGSVTASIKIYQDENMILEQPCVEIKGSGGFGCSLGYPQTPGIYTLKMYIDDTEKSSLDFEVTE